MSAIIPGSSTNFIEVNFKGPEHFPRILIQLLCYYFITSSSKSLQLALHIHKFNQLPLSNLYLTVNKLDLLQQKKKSAYKWTHTAQTHVVQGLTVIPSSPMPFSGPLSQDRRQSLFQRAKGACWDLYFCFSAWCERAEMAVQQHPLPEGPEASSVLNMLKLNSAQHATERAVRLKEGLRLGQGKHNSDPWITY